MDMQSNKGKKEKERKRESFGGKEKQTTLILYFILFFT
jgi:hypothetical protein